MSAIQLRKQVELPNFQFSNQIQSMKGGGGLQQNNISIHSLKKIRDMKYFQDQRGYETDYIKRRKKSGHAINKQNSQSRFDEEVNNFLKGVPMTDANNLDYASETETKLRHLGVKHFGDPNSFKQISQKESDQLRLHSANASNKSTIDASSNGNNNLRMQIKSQCSPTISKVPYRSPSFQSKSNKGLGKIEGKWEGGNDSLQDDTVIARILESSFEQEDKKLQMDDLNQESLDDLMDVDESEGESKVKKNRKNHFSQNQLLQHLPPHRQIYLSPQHSNSSKTNKQNISNGFKNSLHQQQAKSPINSSREMKIKNIQNGYINLAIDNSGKFNIPTNRSNLKNSGNNSPQKIEGNIQNEQYCKQIGVKMKQIIGIRPTKINSAIKQPHTSPESINKSNKLTQREREFKNNQGVENNIQQGTAIKSNREDEDQVRKLEEFYQSQVERQQKLVQEQQRQIALYQQQLQQQTVEFQLYLQEQHLIRQTQLLAQQQQNQLLATQKIFHQQQPHLFNQSHLQNVQNQLQPTPIVINNNISKENFQGASNMSSSLLSPQQQVQKAQQQIQNYQQQQFSLTQNQSQKSCISQFIPTLPLNQQDIGIISSIQQQSLSENQQNTSFAQQQQFQQQVKAQSLQLQSPNQIQNTNRNIHSELNHQNWQQEQSPQDQLTTCSNFNEKTPQSQLLHQQSFTSMTSTRTTGQRKKWDIAQKSGPHSELSLDEDIISLKNKESLHEQKVKKPAVKFEIFWEKDEIEQEQMEKDKEKEKYKESPSKPNPKEENVAVIDICKLDDSSVRKSLQNLFATKKNELQKRLENEKVAQQQAISYKNQAPDISKEDLLQIRKDLLKPKSQVQQTLKQQFNPSVQSDLFNKVSYQSTDLMEQQIIQADSNQIFPQMYANQQFQQNFMNQKGKIQEQQAQNQNQTFLNQQYHANQNAQRYQDFNPYAQNQFSLTNFNNQQQFFSQVNPLNNQVNGLSTNHLISPGVNISLQNQFPQNGIHPLNNQQQSNINYAVSPSKTAKSNQFSSNNQQQNPQSFFNQFQIPIQTNQQMYPSGPLTQFNIPQTNLFPCPPPIISQGGYQLNYWNNQSRKRQ